MVFDEFYASRYGKSTEVVDYLRDASVQVEQFETGQMRAFKELLGQLEN